MKKEEMAEEVEMLRERVKGIEDWLSERQGLTLELLENEKISRTLENKRLEERHEYYVSEQVLLREWRQKIYSATVTQNSIIATGFALVFLAVVFK